MRQPVLSMTSNNQTNQHTSHHPQLARNAPLAVDPFCDNSVANSKYTPLTFVPKAIFEQFRKLANCYFLFMGYVAAVFFPKQHICCIHGWLIH